MVGVGVKLGANLTVGVATIFLGTGFGGVKNLGKNNFKLIKTNKRIKKMETRIMVLVLSSLDLTT